MSLSHRLLAFLVVAAVLTLTPLAQASPPDQTWIGGFYDNADYDEVIVQITSAVSALESHVVWPARPLSVVVSFVAPADPQLIGLLPRPSNPGRAPPIA